MVADECEIIDAIRSAAEVIARVLPTAGDEASEPD